MMIAMWLLPILTKLRMLFRTPIRAAVAGTVISAVLLGSVIVDMWRSHQGGIARWNSGGGLEETPEFIEMIGSSDNRGQWQSGARHTPPDKKDQSGAGVSVYTVPNIQPPKPLPTLRELSDQAQVKAIDAIEHAANSTSRPWDDLRKTLSEDAEPGERDPFLFERVLVATVTKGLKWPLGDRMVWTRVLITPINFKFAAYTIASTESETIKVSSVEATDVRKLSADIGLTIPADAGKVGLGSSRESTIKSTSEVTSQYERLGVDIMPDFLRIIRESGAGGDVIGNTRVALSITTDPALIQKHQPDDAKMPELPIPEINLAVTDVHLEDDGKKPEMSVLPVVPLPHCALQANISALYEQRNVRSGSRFYDESQQDVVFIHDVFNKKSVELMGADDVSPFVWAIRKTEDNDKDNPTEWKLAKMLSAQFGDDGPPRRLVFSDYGRAAKLAHWVRTHSAGIDVSGYKFDRKKGQGLSIVKLTKDECRQEPKNQIVSGN